MSASRRTLPFDFASLRRAYHERTASPVEVAESVLAAIAEGPGDGIWIHRRDPADLLAEARSLERSRDAPGPLYGVPFAVKDSIDLAGVPTTVACPGFAYVPTTTAPALERLRQAGALYVGKTNLDQFATGLVGVRSPYGVPTNPFDARYVTGGSSSGSAAAVARGQVAFAVATDTAGSGRIPAAFNNVVGLKPSRGLVSTRGLVPACRSIDCMTVMTLTCDDARRVASVLTGFDPGDPFSRPEADQFRWQARADASYRRVAVPRADDLVFGDEPARSAFERACADLEAAGFEVERADMAPFYEAGQLLYGGPWIAERLSGLESFVRAHPDALLPVIRTILSDGEGHRATDAFRALHRLAELKRVVEPLWTRVDALVVPTAPFHPRIDEVAADPLAVNVRLGRYTTFANLLDLAAVAVPAGFRPDGLPAGVSLLGPWGSDAALLDLASAVHARAGGSLGATGWALRRPDPSESPDTDGKLKLAVVGAHLAGQPLNGQLTQRGGRFVGAALTAPRYRLYALPATTPPKPGLVRVGVEEGHRIALEVWELPTPAVGSFLAGIAAPLVLGTIELDDGSRVHGFLCEAYATEGAEDISSYGGWRQYLRTRSGADDGG